MVNSDFLAYNTKPNTNN